MSAEKEIVNHWLHKRGFFTIKNIKTSGNKDIGILALRFDNEKLMDVMHIEVSCSISNGMAETPDADKFVESKFLDKTINESVDEHLKQFPGAKKARKVIVM